MENKKLSIEQVFDNTDKIYKEKASYILNAIFIVAGIVALFISHKTSSLADSILSPLFIVIGIAFLAWGVISIFFRKTYYRSKDKQKIFFKELLFDIKERDKLIRIVKEGNVKELKSLQHSTHDALKLRVAYTPDGSICYSQVVTYIPFEFVNATDAIEHTPEQAQIIIEILKSKN